MTRANRFPSVVLGYPNMQPLTESALTSHLHLFRRHNAAWMFGKVHAQSFGLNAGSVCPTKRAR